jgi:hypothetical protein
MLIGNSEGDPVIVEEDEYRIAKLRAWRLPEEAHQPGGSASP